MGRAHLERDGQGQRILLQLFYLARPMQCTGHSHILLTGNNSEIVESFGCTGVGTAALMLSEFTKEVLQQQALSLPSNCQLSYSKVIHTKQAKQRHITGSRHTGPRSPTTHRRGSLCTQSRASRRQWN